jgi:hypothetical protein
MMDVRDQGHGEANSRRFNVANNFGDWCNGSTTDSGKAYTIENPGFSGVFCISDPLN